MSTIVTHSPVVNAIPRFWFSGFPSPRIGLPGSATRDSSSTAPPDFRTSTDEYRVVTSASSSAPLGAARRSFTTSR